MLNLIKRAIDGCNKLKISPESIVEIRDLNNAFEGDDKFVIGTIIKYIQDDNVPVYVVLNLNGWVKQYPCRDKADIVHAIRDLANEGYKNSQIAQILGTSPSQISKLKKSKNIGNHDDKIDD